MIVTKNLRIDFDDNDKEKQEEVAADMPVSDTVVAIEADPKSCESFYLKKISEEEKQKTEDVENDFSQVIKKGMKHLEKMFLERNFDSGNVYTIPKKPRSAFFFREGAVLPSVQLSQKSDILNLVIRSR